MAGDSWHPEDPFKGKSIHNVSSKNLCCEKTDFQMGAHSELQTTCCRFGTLVSCLSGKQTGFFCVGM